MTFKLKLLEIAYFHPTGIVLKANSKTGTEGRRSTGNPMWRRGTVALGPYIRMRLIASRCPGSWGMLITKICSYRGVTSGSYFLSEHEA